MTAVGVRAAASGERKLRNDTNGDQVVCHPPPRALSRYTGTQQRRLRVTQAPWGWPLARGQRENSSGQNAPPTFPNPVPSPALRVPHSYYPGNSGSQPLTCAHTVPPNQGALHSEPRHAEIPPLYFTAKPRGRVGRWANSMWVRVCWMSR